MYPQLPTAATAKPSCPLSQKHGNLIPIQADVTDKASLLRAAEQVAARHGFVNLVVANAGISGPGMAGLPAEPSVAQLRAHLLSWDTDDMARVFAVNNVGVLATVAAFLELLAAGNTIREGFPHQQKSQVVAIASGAGFSRSPVGGFMYASSKAGVVHLAKTMATTFVPHDIRVNVIAPGCECASSVLLALLSPNVVLY